MEKYAVELDDEKTKVASTNGSTFCPKCSAPTKTSWCSKCGTEPFEKVKKPTGEQK